MKDNPEMLLLTRSEKYEDMNNPANSEDSNILCQNISTESGNINLEKKAVRGFMVASMSQKTL